MLRRPKKEISVFAVQSPFAPSLSKEDAVLQAELLRALADPTRLQILNLLSLYEGVVSVSDIVECLPLEQPTISHHFHILRKARLVSYQKKGRWIYYSVRQDTLKHVQQIIENLMN
jgi:ArsR family transcriptional regulator